MNTNEKQQFHAHWEKVRRRGIVLYVLAVAVSWGTVFAVFFRFLYVLLEQDLNLDALQAAFLSRNFLDFWGCCMLAGLLPGLLLWFFYQWQFRRMMNDE